MTNEHTDLERTVEPVIEAYGQVTDGIVTFQRSWTYEGNPIDTPDVDVQRRLADNHAEPVDIALVGVEGEALRATTVPDRLEGTHGDETVHAVTVSLPFPRGGIWLEASYGRGATTRLNAIVHPLEDAVGRVPDRGLVDPEESRQRLNGPLSEADEAMRTEQFGRAATILQGRFSDAIAEEVRPYESFANEPTAEQLLSFAERQSTRLLNL